MSNYQLSINNYQLPDGYKQTEVGVIPESWEVIPITKATNEIFLGLTARVDYVESGGIPLVRATDIAKGKLSFDKARTISIQQHKKLTKYRRAKRGDILVSKSGSLGVCAIVDTDQEFSIYESIIVLQANSSLDSNFLLSLIRDEQTQVRMIGEKVGSTVGHLNLEMFRKLIIPLPPLPEQRAIATTLSDVDALIAALDKLIAKQRHLKTATMQQLLTGKKRLPRRMDNGELIIDNDGNPVMFGPSMDNCQLSIDNYQLPKGYKQTEVGIIPEDWDVRLLGSLANIQRGASPRPIDSPVWFDRNSLVGWVRISDVTRSGMYLHETEQKLSPLGIQHSRPVSKGSLVMSICATVGRPIITEIDVCIHDGFVVFDNLQTEQLFMYYVLKWIEPSWSKQGQTGSQMNLNTELINGTVVCLPSAPEQREIATVLSDMDAEIAAIEARRAKTQAIKQGMMQQLLTGKVRLLD